MNIRISICLLLWSLIIATSCDTPDNNHPGAIEPPNIIREAFNAIYPEAQNAIWTVSHNYYVIHFTSDATNQVAWLNHLGVWAMLKKEIPLEQLPTDIITALQTGEHADWIIENCYLIERAGMGTVYKVEVTNDKQKKGLYYTQYGELIQSVDATTQTDMPISIPESVTQFMETYYPQAELLDIQNTSSGIQLAILADRNLKFVVINP